VEDLTSRPAATGVPPLADTLTSAARLIVSLLPDPHRCLPVPRENNLGKLFAG